MTGSFGSKGRDAGPVSFPAATTSVTMDAKASMRGRP